MPFVAALLVLLTACGDSRVRNLEVGISKDSVLKIVGAGAPAGDTLPNVYKHAQYFVEGKMFDIYLFDPENRDLSDDPTVTDDDVTPLVVIDGKLAGTGWSYMDGVTDKYRIQMRAVR